MLSPPPEKPSDNSIKINKKRNNEKNTAGVRNLPVRNFIISLLISQK